MQTDEPPHSFPCPLAATTLTPPTDHRQPKPSDLVNETTHIRPGKHFIQVEPFWLKAEDAPRQSSVVVELTEGEIEDGIELTIDDK